MTRALNKRRLLLFFALIVVTGIAVGLLARLTLTEMAVGSLLKMAGASDVKFSVTQASPWRVVMEDIGFQIKTQLFAAKRVSMERPHWWTSSLGVVRVEEARLPITIDGSVMEPQAYKNAAFAQSAPAVPVDEVYIDGQVIVRAAEQPDQALAVKLEAQLIAKNTWTGKIQVDGPGLAVKGEGTYTLASDRLDFKLPSIALDLKPWQGFVQRLIVLPNGTWEIEGKLNGSAEGSLTEKKLVAGGAIRLREGRVHYETRHITAEGIEADLEFIDFDQVVTKPGTIRAREVRVGNFPMRDLIAEVALAGSEKVVVSNLSLQALGGRASAEPFKYFPRLREIDVVLLVDSISIEEVMALTQDLPAKATGRVNGRFPVRIDDSGVRLGSGWLELKPGVYAELQLKTTGLLTNGMAENGPSYAVLKQVESGLLKLKISELRLDIRPPNAPPGRSAQLRISASPVDPNVKAPVTLDLNVNGPLEKLLNLGLDSRLSFK